MKKWFAYLLAFAMIFTLAACSSAPAENTSGDASGAAPSGEASGDGISIMLVTQGAIGDMGIEDIVKVAIDKFCSETGATLDIAECKGDASLYEPTMMDVSASGEYDVIITGFYNLVEATQAAASAYPDQKYIIYDAEIDHADGKFANVRSVQSTQNEVSFLTGALAAMMSESEEAEFSNPDKTVGFVGAAENTAIQDFLVGYIEGVKYVDPEIKVLYSYVGNWADTAKAKELALSQYNQGADVSFSVCGSAGLGVADASKESNVYSIGVDYDFAATIAKTNPETADHVVTSAIKDFDTIITNELKSIQDGSMKWGTHDIYNFAQKGSSLVKNDYYEKLVPQEIKDKMTEIETKLAAGEIEVHTSIGASEADMTSYLKQAEPMSK